MTVNNLYLYSHNPNSEGAKALAEALDIPRIRHHNSRFRPQWWKTVINWGSSALPNLGECNILNLPDKVARVVNKLEFFQALQQPWHGGSDLPLVNIPQFCTDPAIVRDELLQHPNTKWLARTQLTSHSGQGIIIVTDPDNIPPAPLYVKYVPKKHEYRVHIFREKVIHVQRKALRSDYTGQRNWTVRSHDNGFKFVHGSSLGTVPEDVIHQSRLSISVSGLDFGAVDVIWNQEQGRAYVLEINTAPGIENTTVEKYKDAFRGLIPLGTS